MAYYILTPLNAIPNLIQGSAIKTNMIVIIHPITPHILTVLYESAEFLVAINIIVSIRIGTRSPSATAIISSADGLIDEAAKSKTKFVKCQTKNKDIGIITKANKDRAIFFMAFNIG